MKRVLIVPAAGHGTRLRSPLPKLLVPVGGRPMIDWLFDLYADRVDHRVIVTSPAALAAVTAHVKRLQATEVAVQDQPTGMLDAILIGAERAAAQEPESIWITWCDQVGVHPATVDRLSALSSSSPAPALVMPTVWQESPYIHLDRDDSGRITRVRHRREGDAMPARGESDMGLFAISAHACFDLLPQYAGVVETGTATRERNFLPFIPWVAARGEVTTFPSRDPEEAIGVNTPEDLQAVEAYLRRRT